MRIIPLYMLEAGAFNYWMDLPRDGFTASSWTGRYRRLVGIETCRLFWRWWK